MLTKQAQPCHIPNACEKETNKKKKLSTIENIPTHSDLHSTPPGACFVLFCNLQLCFTELILQHVYAD